MQGIFAGRTQLRYPYGRYRIHPRRRQNLARRYGSGRVGLDRYTHAVLQK